jgi:hypothetical protein
LPSKAWRRLRDTIQANPLPKLTEPLLDTPLSTSGDRHAP